MRKIVFFLISLALSSSCAQAGGLLGDIMKTVPNINNPAAIQKSLGASIEFNSLKLPTIVRQTLAERAAPIAISAQEGETIRSTAERRCPGSAPEYFELLQSSFQKLNPKIAINQANQLLDSKLQSKSIIYIPFCVGRIHIVQASENLWSQFQRERDTIDKTLSWEQYQLEYLRLNPQKRTDSDWQLGEQLLLPTIRLDIPLVPDSPSDVELKKVLSEWGVIENVKPNYYGTLEAEDRCEGKNATRSETFAEGMFQGISNALMTNDYVDNKSSQWSRDDRPVRVAVLDSGFSGENNTFYASLIKKISLGITPEDMHALPGFDQTEHGTAVIVLTIGGTLFGQVSPLLRAIEIAPFRVVEPGADPSTFVVAQSRLMEGMGYVNHAQNHISIVNLSLRFPEEIPNFTDYVGNTQPFLIVAAAGNAGEEFSENYSAYPAMHGGNEDNNFITVAGVDQFNNLTINSNFSNSQVDIAAWGCDVPTFKLNESTNSFEKVYFSGTSVAAPQVVFTAAMLKREERTDRSLTPVELKRRLISSADLHPELWARVKHGRVLNIHKALLLHTDVVEMDDGRLLTGKLAFNDGETQVEICPDVTMRTKEIRKIADVRSLVAIPNGPPKRYLIYREKNSAIEPEKRPFEEIWCERIFAKYSLEHTATGKVEILDPAHVKDVVMSLYNE